MGPGSLILHPPQRIHTCVPRPVPHAAPVLSLAWFRSLTAAPSQGLRQPGGGKGYKEGWRAQLHPEQGKEVPRASAPCQKRMGVRREMIIRDRISCDTIRDPVSCDAMSAAFFKRHCSPYSYPSRRYPLQTLTCSASLTSVTSVTGLPPRCACISWAAWRACSTAACIARSCFSSGDTRWPPPL